MGDITTLCYIDSTGYHFADYPTTLTWLQTQYLAIYGPDVYLGSDSQDGQFLGILAQSFYDMFSVGASIYNSFSPQTAQGVGLSSVVQINGLQRNISTFSTVSLEIVGASGTSLTGAFAIDTLQQQWALPDTIIPADGTVTVVATSVATGSIQALPGTVTGIFTPVLGWQSVNNPSAATVGAGVETDAELRLRQAISVANPSLTAFDSTLGAVGNVPGVSAYAGYENDTGVTDSNGLPPHSISIVVTGDYSQDAVAAAIQIKKTPGTSTYGDISVPTVDSQGVPLTIYFYNASTTTVGVQVNITHLTGYGGLGTDALIQTSLSNYISSLPIGSDIVITQLYAYAYVGGATTGTYTISSIELSDTGTGPYYPVDLQIAFNSLPICATTNVVLNPP